MPLSNPCVSCGACCACYRVSFPVDQGRSENGPPVELTEPLNADKLCMKGTNQDSPRCEALSGEVGVETRCTIYEQRPGPCRRFGIQWSNDKPVISRRDWIWCNRARSHHRLPRLSKRRFTILPAPFSDENEDHLSDGTAA